MAFLAFVFLPRRAEDLVAGAELGERLEGGFHHVGVVGGTERLGEDVADADRFADGAHAATGDDARSRRGRLEQHLAAAELGVDLVRDGAVDDASSARAPCGRASLALRMASATSLALPKPKPTLPMLVAGDDEGGEAEATTALDDLGAAVDEDDLLGQFVAFGVGGRRALFAARAAAAAAAATAEAAALAAAALIAAVDGRSVAGPLLGWRARTAPAAGAAGLRLPERRRFGILGMVTMMLCGSER